MHAADSEFRSTIPQASCRCEMLYNHWPTTSKLYVNTCSYFLLVLFLLASMGLYIGFSSSTYAEFFARKFLAFDLNNYFCFFFIIIIISFCTYGIFLLGKVKVHFSMETIGGKLKIYIL